MLNFQLLKINCLCDIAVFCFFSHCRAHQVGQLALMEFNGNRNILRLGLKLNLSVSLRVGHHECNIVEQRVRCAVRLLLEILVQRIDVGVKSIAFHALCDLGNNQLGFVRNGIRRLHVDENADVIVIVHI